MATYTAPYLTGLHITVFSSSTSVLCYIFVGLFRLSHLSGYLASTGVVNGGVGYPGE